MKKLKSIVLSIALLLVCGAVNAKTISNVEPTAKQAVSTYIDAMTHGKLAGLNDVVDKSAKFSMLRGKELLSFDKKEMLSFMSKTKNVEQACSTTTSVVESTADVAVIKVDMKFENFTRTNYLTVANTGKGWKITNVYSVFK